MKNFEHSSSRLRRFWEKHPLISGSVVALGSVALGWLLASGSEQTPVEDLECGVGVVDATGGTAWNTSGEAAQDAGVTHPDMVSASGMLANKAAEQPYGLQPNQAYVMCFDGINPVSAEPTVLPIEVPTPQS